MINEPFAALAGCILGIALGLGLYVIINLPPEKQSTLERDCSLVGTHVINETTAIQCIVLRKADQPETDKKTNKPEISL